MSDKQSICYALMLLVICYDTIYVYGNKTKQKKGKTEIKTITNQCYL